MKKLIVKTQLADPERFSNRAERIGLEFSPTIWQHERIYAASDYRRGTNQPRLVLRTEVRSTDQPAQYYLYLKRHIEDSGVDVVNFTPVGDYTEATGIVHQLGFRKVAEISRQRREKILDAQTALYLDIVEGLSGTFLKAEAGLEDGVPVEALRKELFRTLELFGQKTFVLQTYADLMTEQMQPYYLPGKEVEV